MDNEQNNVEQNIQQMPEIEEKKSKKWIIAIILILLCIGLFILVFISKDDEKVVNEVIVEKTVIVEEPVEEVKKVVEETPVLVGEWVPVYTDEGTGSKNTKVFQIDRENAKAWKIIYTFEGGSDTSKLYIESMTPPLAYGGTVADYVTEGGEVVFPDATGPHYLKIGTDDESAWTVQIQQLIDGEMVSNSLDDSVGEWIQIYADEGMGSKNTETFEISEEGSKGWELIYTFEGSSDTETLYIEKMTPPLAYGDAVVEYVYDDGKVVFDEDSNGTFFLRVGTNDESVWTIKVRQLIEK